MFGVRLMVFDRFPRWQSVIACQLFASQDDRGRRRRPHRATRCAMPANSAMRRFGICSLAAAAAVLVLPCGSRAVAAGEAAPYMVLPGEAPRYGGQQGREA